MEFNENEYEKSDLENQIEYDDSPDTDLVPADDYSEVRTSDRGVIGDVAVAAVGTAVTLGAVKLFGWAGKKIKGMFTKNAAKKAARIRKKKRHEVSDEDLEDIEDAEYEEIDECEDED